MSSEFVYGEYEVIEGYYELSVGEKIIPEKKHTCSTFCDSFKARNGCRGAYKRFCIAGLIKSGYLREISYKYFFIEHEVM